MRQPPTPDQFIQQLREIPLFAEFDDMTLQTLAQGARWREYDTGEVVVLEGETTSSLFYLQFGWLKVVKLAPNGREQTLRFLEPGETFNEIGVFTDQPTPATAVALEPTGIWMIPKGVMMSLLHERPDIAQHLIPQMAERLIHLVALVTDLSLRSVMGRLARLLLDDSTNDVLHRPRWYTQAELSARLGTVPDVVQRALRSLQDEQLIEVDRTQIRILDRVSLTKIAT